MEIQMYSVYDVKSGLFTAPFLLPNDAEAWRGFQHACTDPNAKFSLYPSDFDLRHIGVYDDETATISQTVIRSLGTAEKALLELNRAVVAQKAILDSLKPSQIEEALGPELVAKLLEKITVSENTTHNVLDHHQSATEAQ